MFHQIMHFDVEPLNLVIRAIVVFFSVLLLLRISGKKQIGQMGATEFVAILLISNAVQNAMNGGDNSLSGGVLLAAVLIALSSGISYFSYRSARFRMIFEGTPTLLVFHGKVIPKHLHKEQLSEAELKVLLRKQGIHEFRCIQSAILESDGTLTVTKIEE